MVFNHFLSDIFPICLQHFSPTFTSALPPLLPPHYRQNNICTDIYSDIYTDKTASTFSVHRPAANLITFAKLSQRDKNRRKGDYTLLYIGILRENGGDYIIEYQQLKSFIVQVVAISLCKLWLFHCASCGIFIVQVVAVSLCKLRISHKKWCSIPQNETPLI